MRKFLALAICLIAAPVRSDDETNRLAVELARLTLSAEQYKATIQTILTTMNQMMPPEQRERQTQSVSKLIPSYEEQTDLMAGLFAKYYSAGDLKELLAFYRSPVGQKWITVQPEVMRDVMASTMERVRRELPRLKKELKQEKPAGK